MVWMDFFSENWLQWQEVKDGVANGFPKENELAYSLSIAKTSRAVAAFNIVPVDDEREDRPLSLCVSPLEMRVIWPFAGLRALFWLLSVCNGAQKTVCFCSYRLMQWICEKSV